MLSFFIKWFRKLVTYFFPRNKPINYKPSSGDILWFRENGTEKIVLCVKDEKSDIVMALEPLFPQVKLNKLPENISRSDLLGVYHINTPIKSVTIDAVRKKYVRNDHAVHEKELINLKNMINKDGNINVIFCLLMIAQVIDDLFGIEISAKQIDGQDAYPDIGNGSVESFFSHNNHWIKIS
jgi:hypothetical protein